MRARATGVDSGGYDWRRDYPVSKQHSRGSHPTTIRLNLTLDDTEVREFYAETGIRNNGELPVELRLSQTSASFGVVKKGPGAANHRENARQIAQFVVSHLDFVSVHAIRTGEQARSLANDLMRIRMGETLKSPEYLAKIEELNQMRRSTVAELQSDIAASLRTYLPSVEAINIQVEDVEMANLVRDVEIDDGVLTSIENKGDGVKSIVTMALIRDLARLRNRSDSFILAVDEPEAHLHPASVHELQRLFQQISETQQVILATHNPIFVNRDNPKSNVLVVGNDATPARNVLQVRDALGVQLHDNMESAEMIVLVEGVSDEIVLPRLLLDVDSRWQTQARSGRIVFRPTHGTGKVRAQIQREKSSVCRIVVVLDDDNAGRLEAKQLIELGLLAGANVFMLGDSSRRHSELEDLLQPDCYLPVLSSEFGRTFSATHFRNASRKWSENLADALRHLGVAGDPETLETQAKTAVARAVSECETPVLSGEARDRMTALSELLLGPAN